MSEPIPLWLDCDPGHDDAFAILLSAYHPGIKLLGISTIFGNAPLSKTTYNATSILTAIGKPDIPVYAGASVALSRPPLVPPTDIHGSSGIDGTDLLPRPITPAITSVPAVDAMAAALRATAPGSACLVATGALTNVAALFRAHPDLATHLRGLSLMGGAIGDGFTDAVLGKIGGKARMGNWTEFAEFNILIDPEAADEVLGAKGPCKGLKGKVTMIPLDISHLVLATAEVQKMLLHGPGGEEEGAGEEAHEHKGEGKTTLRTMLVELLTFFAKTYRDVFGITAGPPLHDPLAVAAVLTGTQWEIPFYDYPPSSAEKAEKPRERFQVDVVTEGTHEDAHAGAETGRTVVTLLGEGKEGVRIPRGLDIDMFWKVIEDCLEKADAVNAKNGVF